MLFVSRFLHSGPRHRVIGGKQNVSVDSVLDKKSEVQAASLKPSTGTARAVAARLDVSNVDEKRCHH
jgi:hypothetical protein